MMWREAMLMLCHRLTLELVAVVLPKPSRLCRMRRTKSTSSSRLKLVVVDELLGLEGKPLWAISDSRLTKMP